MFQCWSIWFCFCFSRPSFISAIQYSLFWKWITRHTVTYVIYNLLYLTLHQKLSCFQQSTSSNRTTDTSYEKIVLCSNSTIFQMYLLCNLVFSAGFLLCSLARKLIRDKKDDVVSSDIFTVIYAQLLLLLISLSLRLLEGHEQWNIYRYNPRTVFLMNSYDTTTLFLQQLNYVLQNIYRASVLSSFLQASFKWIAYSAVCSSHTEASFLT